MFRRCQGFYFSEKQVLWYFVRASVPKAANRLFSFLCMIWETRLCIDTRGLDMNYPVGGRGGGGRRWFMRRGVNSLVRWRCNGDRPRCRRWCCGWRWPEWRWTFFFLVSGNNLQWILMTFLGSFTKWAFIARNSSFRGRSRQNSLHVSHVP